MLNTLRTRVAERAEQGDDGFTLIELLVVLLIMGVLLAIAIPTYLSVTKSANTTAAQSNLETALTGAKAYYVNNSQTYGSIGDSSITDTSLTYTTAGDSTYQGLSNGPSVISIANDGPNALVMAAKSVNGTCYAIVDLEQDMSSSTIPSIGTSSTTTGINSTAPAGTYYSSFTPTNTLTCSAAAAASSSGPTFQEGSFPSSN